MAIVTHHTLLVMDIGRSSVLSGKFGIDATAMTGRAGFSFIFLDELMALQQAGGDAADRRRFNVAAATGGMTGSAGIFKNFFIESLQLFCRKAVLHAFALPEAGVVKGLGVILSGLDMANAASINIIRRSGNASLVGIFFCFTLFVPLMTGNAFHGEMEILADHFLVYQITLVIFFRPDRGRGSRSPLGLLAYFRGLDQRLHLSGIRMTLSATSAVIFSFQQGVRLDVFPTLVAFCATRPGKFFFAVVTVEAIILRAVRFQSNAIGPFPDLEEL